ncbi:MAG TPA: PAS domain-containing protein [Gammaproteobacteria bacterium]
MDLQRLVDASPAVHYLARVSGDFETIYISPAVHAQLGYAPEQLTADPGLWSRLVHPDDRPRVLAALAHIAEQPRQALEYRLRHANGGWRWLHDQLALLRDDEGEPPRIVGSRLDITERKEAEERTREIASRLQEAQSIAGIGSWEVDILTSSHWWSDEMYRIFGEDPRTFEPRRDTLLAKIHPEDRQRVIDTVDRAYASGEPYSIVYRILLPDGTERIVQGRGRCIARKDGEGSPTRFAGTVQDITEREHTEQALRAAEARNRALLEANPDVIFRIDADGRYLDLSVSPKTLFPYTKETLVGRNVRDLFSEEFAREHQEHVRRAIETGEMQLWECRLPLPHGDIDLEARFVRSGDNEAVVTVRDVTEWLALQRDIVATQERERSRIGRDLHDGLGQELTALSLALEVLAQKLATEASPHAQAVDNLKAMAQKAIVTTRRIARSLSPGFGRELLIGEALEALAGEVSEHSNVTCRAICSRKDHAHDVELDTNLYRIAQEAVTNALRHGAPRNVELRYACDGKSIRLEVLDDGVGIAPEKVRRGGMGLRSMRYRAHLIHGHLEIERRPEGGTRVSCSCPCLPWQRVPVCKETR